MLFMGKPPIFRMLFRILGLCSADARALQCLLFTAGFSFSMQLHSRGKTSFCEGRLYRALLGVTPTLIEYASLGIAANRSSSVLSSPIARMKLYCCFESQFCAARPLLIMELLISITLFPSSTSRLRFEIDERIIFFHQFQTLTQKYQMETK